MPDIGTRIESTRGHLDPAKSSGKAAARNSCFKLAWESPPYLHPTPRGAPLVSAEELKQSYNDPKSLNQRCIVLFVFLHWSLRNYCIYVIG